MVYVDSSTEQLQSRLSSLMSENSSLKENRMDSEAKIRRLQVDTFAYSTSRLSLEFTQSTVHGFPYRVILLS